MNLSIKNYIDRNKIVMILLLFIICFLFFPNNNPTLDAFSYAADVKYKFELFSPHHLFYNSFYYVLINFIGKIYGNIEILRFMQITNGIFSVASLFIAYLILKKILQQKNKAVIWVLFIGSSFAILRYSTENETYIIPIFFSLLSSLFFLKYINLNKWYFPLLSGLFGSIACLFHQVQIFWVLGIFSGIIMTKNKKAVLLFLLSTLIIPICYIVVFLITSKLSLTTSNLLKFVLSYYFSEDSNTFIGISNFILTPISLFRTFFQVHGNLIDFIKYNPIFYSLSLIFIFFLFKKISFKKPKILKRNKDLNLFFKAHLIIFLGQILFAFISNGNAEFMVMLPYLVAILLPFYFKINYNSLKYFSVTMFLWNMIFAIVPNHIYDYHNNKVLINTIKENPQKIFVLNEKNLIANQYFYYTGINISERLFTTSSTSLNIISEKRIIFTDVLSKRMPFNRASLTENKNEINLDLIRHIKKVPSFYGDFYIDEVTLKNNITN